MFDPLVSAHFNSPSSLTDTLIDQINKEKIYEPLFKDRHDLVFLDIGANIGLVSIYAAPACRRIIAVEPDPDTFQVLKGMTISCPNIELVNAALAPMDGPVDFYRNDINTTANSTVNTAGTKTTVQGLTLSSILRINQLEHVDVVKCDAEGSEGESLSFEELEMAGAIVDCYYIETHNCPKTTWQHKLGSLVNRLSDLGYWNMKFNGMALIARK